MALAPALLIAAGAHAGTQFFTDPAFMHAIPHTLIDFETNKFGEPIVLEEGEAFGTSGSFYNDLGILFGGATLLIGNPIGDFDAALTAGASPSNRMGLEPSSSFPIGESAIAPVRAGETPFSAFGIFIMENSRFAEGLVIELQAFDGTVLASKLIDESVLTNQIGDARYGFLGFETDEPVAGVVLLSHSLTAYGFDDLRFAVAPSSGTLPAFGYFGLCALRRRRRG
ncbi:MAG: hypothetical protein ACF8QF_08705 [Phycisphaerales bacterium]